MYNVQKVSWTNNGIAVIKRLAEEFVLETNHGITYDEHNVLNSIYARLADTSSAMFFIGDNRIKVGGLIMCQYENSWQKENLGYIEKFYVAKDSRGTPVGRALFAAAVKWFDENKVLRSFLTDTAGIQSDVRLVNLARKFGYNTGGAIMVRNEQI